MSSRGRKMVRLVTAEDDEILRRLDLPSYESTKGVDYKTINTEDLKLVLGLGTTGAVTQGSCQKLVAYVTPIKKTAQAFTPTGAQNSAVRNLNTSLNEVLQSENVSGSEVGDHSNTHFTAEHNYNTRRLNNKYAITDEENGLEHYDSTDPFEDSGSSYSPSVVSDTSDSTSEFVTQEVAILGANAEIEEDKRQNSRTELMVQSIEITETEITGNEIEVDQENEAETNLHPIEVSLGEVKRNKGKRIRDKGHSCYFCQEIVYNNFSRHIEMHHGNETEAARILAMPKSSKRRRDAFANLIRYGDFYHNCEVLSSKQGQIILTRRPNTQELASTSYSEYGPCPECLGFMLKRQIWHHLKYTCCSKGKILDEAESKSSSKGPMAESGALLNGILGKNFETGFRDIINQFRNDTISSTCKQDDTIMRYGAFLYEKYSSTQSELIRQSMRQLGRLTLEMRKQGECFQNLCEVLIPEKFDSIVNATKEMCKATRDDPTKRPEFQTPSLALKIGYAIKKCASIERGQCLRRGDLRGNKQLLAFLHLLNLEWSVRVSSNALATLHLRKQNAEDLLPVTSDLLKLNNFLDSEIRKAKENLSSLNYSKLSSLTLARIIMFNKRRSGETAKMTLTQYLSRPNWKNVGTEELKNSLTPFEKKIASTLTIVKIVGKRGRVVPTLLMNDMKESLELIVSKRVEYGVPSENPYVFAIPNTTSSHLRGHDCLRKWCTEAGLNSPDLITSTKLRKYVATVCQIFNLNENEYDWLARHLGHDVRVHREFYRLQENAVELTKVSRLLLAVDQGEAHKFVGKELKDINLTDMDGIEDKEGVKGLQEEDSEDEEINQKDNIAENSLLEMEDRTLDRSTKGKNIKKKCAKKLDRRPWTSEEKEIILKEFKSLIKIGTLPGKEQCIQLMEKHKIFMGRKWTDLKFFIKNHVTKLKRRHGFSSKFV